MSITSFTIITPITSSTYGSLCVGRKYFLFLCDCSVPYYASHQSCIFFDFPKPFLLKLFKTWKRRTYTKLIHANHIIHMYSQRQREKEDSKDPKKEEKRFSYITELCQKHQSRQSHSLHQKALLGQIHVKIKHMNHINYVILWVFFVSLFLARKKSSKAERRDPYKNSITITKCDQSKMRRMSTSNSPIWQSWVQVEVCHTGSWSCYFVGDCKGKIGVGIN